jgi:hypothetical protein
VGGCYVAIRNIAATREQTDDDRGGRHDAAVEAGSSEA